MEFQKFGKIPRLSRDVIVTEKLDGTNAQVALYTEEQIVEYYNEFVDGCSAFDPVQKAKDFINDYSLDVCNQTKLHIFAGSRKRWLDITSDGDNYGFAKWVQANSEELLKLGEGRHFGEWYGQGIQRKYGLDHKRFALFNVKKWADDELRPKCCEVVPILYQGEFNTDKIASVVDMLGSTGSKAVEGFMNPEGVIVYHTASGKLFKKTVKDDEKPKGSNES